MKISTVKKLFVEDFGADNRTFIQKLAVVLNPFLDQTTTALTNNLTPRDNLKSKVWALDLAAGVSTATVAWDVNEAPTHVTISKLNKKNGNAPSAAFALSWSYGNKQVTLTFLGLDGSTEYTATVLGLV